MSISALILAAGDSSRMQQPKALLQLRGRSFLQSCIEAMSHSSVREIIVVTGSAHVEIEEHVRQRGLSVSLVRNPDPKRGQFSSLQCGIAALPTECDAFIVHLVDHPLVKTETAAAIIERFEKTKAKIVVPSFEKRRGHPVLYSSALFDEIIKSSGDLGARAIHAAHADEIEFVEVNDPGIRIDIDTPEEYRRIITQGE